jgi:hypothetical protein
MVSYGDPDHRTATEQGDGSDLGALMQQGGTSSDSGEQKDPGADLLKNLQQNEK